jgi:KaiC/GvpD/RAD55 family RecA-like ATPase
VAQEQARSLMQLIQSQLNVTTLFTAHCNEGNTAGVTHGVEQFLASGVLIFKTTEACGTLERSMLVKKMRATAVEPAEHRFVIRKREGIVLADLPADVFATMPMFELFEPKKNLPEL